MQKVAKIIATLSFIGFSPFAPGTIASLAAVGVYLLIKGNTLLHLALTLFFLIVGFWSARVAEKSFSRKDPPEIVIDEFSSMLLAYLFVPPKAIFIITGFILFRFFDIFKIPPIKKLENLPKGYGIMLDDIASAISTGIILQAIHFTFPSA